jgi:hypothetical protein
MKSCYRFFVLALVGLAAGLVPDLASAQNQPQEDPTMKAAMAAWQAYGTPGAPHKELARSVGTWSVGVKCWYEPGTPPKVSKATSEITPWWDGRYVIEKLERTKPEGPVHGFSISGYDNLKKKLVTTWMDNMSTGVMVFEGTTDASGKVMILIGEMPDPPSSHCNKSRSMVTIIDNKIRKLESFAPGPDGKELKSMELLYTRK